MINPIRSRAPIIQPHKGIVVRLSGVCGSAMEDLELNDQCSFDLQHSALLKARQRRNFKADEPERGLLFARGFFISEAVSASELLPEAAAPMYCSHDRLDALNWL